MSLSALIIDDEKGNREYLTKLIQHHCPEIEPVYQAGSASDGLMAVRKYRPEVVFLDIEMPGGSGFDFLKKLDQIDFKIIFVTAYDAYALRAIKYSALDYLLKPVDPEELKQAVLKLSKDESQGQKLNLLNDNLSQSENRRIALSTQEEVIFVPIDEIVHLKAEANYTRVFLQNQGEILLSGNLGYYEKLLSDQRFYRTHQSHLINKDHVRKYVKTEGGYFIMSDGSQVPIARLKREEMKRIFSI